MYSWSRMWIMYFWSRMWILLSDQITHFCFFDPHLCVFDPALNGAQPLPFPQMVSLFVFLIPKNVFFDPSPSTWCTPLRWTSACQTWIPNPLSKLNGIRQGSHQLHDFGWKYTSFVRRWSCSALAATPAVNWARVLCGSGKFPKAIRSSWMQSRSDLPSWWTRSQNCTLQA